MHKIFISTLAISLLLGSCQENFDNHLKREASAYTLKHCPLRIEDGNTLDSLTYDIETRNLIRWHSLSGVMDTQEAKDVILHHPDLIRKQLLRELRNDPQKGNCKDEKILFTYVYRSASTKDTVFKTTFTPTDYQR